LNKVIEASGLSKSYDGNLVLDIQELSVERGETLAVLGPSGAGKSVLLRVLSLLEPATSGKLLFLGDEVQDLKGRERVEVSRRMVMLFQDPYLFRGTVLQNVCYGLKVRRLKEGETKGRAAAALRTVGLEGFEERSVRTLSGGEAQRVALARALVIEPEAMFLDEPFASLDRLNRSGLQVEVRRILEDSGITAIFVTHDQEEAARVGDRIAVLEVGRVTQAGTPEEVFYRPATESAARFVGMENIYSGTVTGAREGLTRVEVQGVILELVSDRSVGEAVTVGLRPEDVTLVPERELDSRSSSRNALVGEVVGIELMGPTVRVTVNCPFPVVSLITRRSMDELYVTVGENVGLRFKATALHII